MQRRDGIDEVEHSTSFTMYGVDFAHENRKKAS